MKKSIFSLLAIALMASAANAATIGLQWADAPGSQISGPGTVNVVLETIQGDSVSTIIFNFNDVANISMNNATAGLNGWNVGGQAGPLQPGTQYAVAATAGNNLESVFSGVAGTFDLSVNDGNFDGSEKEITFDAAANVAGVLDGSGGKIAWDARYNTTYSGYIAYGDFGNPGWGTKTAMGHQPTANPLIITKTPEPSSLALIALGGFALLRRSR